MSALDGLPLQAGNRKFFILVTDASTHDVADGDGLSKLRITDVADTLFNSGVSVLVVTELNSPFELALPTSRAFHFVCPKGREKRPNVRAFRDWIKAEMAGMDFGRIGVGGGRRE